MLYNVRVKTYPDGHKQYFWSSEPIFRLDEENDPEWIVDDVLRRRKAAKRRREIQSFDVADIEDPEPEFYEREKRNMSRSIQIVYDLARSNDFDWFITLTLSPEKVNRYDYDSCADAIKLFTKRLLKLGCKWLIVPEQHEDGAFHFHGLVQGNIPLTPSGKMWYNEIEGYEQPVYNLANYGFGWTTATEIIHPHRCATYVTKYLTKKPAVPKGKKCYWASKSLSRPSVEYLQTEHWETIYDPDAGEVCSVLVRDNDWAFGAPLGIRYIKEIENEYGRFVISEE